MAGAVYINARASMSAGVVRSMAWAEAEAVHNKTIAEAWAVYEKNKDK